MDYELPIYVINLKSSIKRRLHVLKELSKLSVPHKIIMVEAVTVQEAKQQKYCLSEKAYKNIVFKLQSTAVVPTWGAFACALSHIKCWKMILENTQPYSLIVEDDLLIEQPEKFQFRLYNALFHLRKHSYDYEIIGDQRANKIEPHIFVFDARRDLSKQIHIYKNVEKLRCVFTNIHCYMLNTEAAKLMIPKSFPLTFQVDIQMSYISKNNKLHIYNYFDGGTKQEKFFSSLVQYYFIRKEELMELLDTIPEDIVMLIYSYLPTKPKKTYYGYHITDKLSDYNISVILNFSNY
tara:strand:+ start:481 stop:1359 length:879 start_codon:yes stop_codon:yes gene_type:complete